MAGIQAVDFGVRHVPLKGLATGSDERRVIAALELSSLRNLGRIDVLSEVHR